MRSSATSSASGYGIEPIDFYSEALRLVQLRLASVGYDAGLGGLTRARACASASSRDYYYPQLGGITEHVHGQAVNLAARGHEVTIVTGRLPHAPRAADRDERVLDSDDVRARAHGPGAAALRQRLADAAHASAARRTGSCAASSRAAVRRRARPRALQPELLHARPLRAARRHDRRRHVSLRVHAGPRCAISCTRPRAPSLSRLHGHIVVSDACIEPLDHYFPEFDWRVIPNGIDEDHFAPGAAPIDALRESGDPVVALPRALRSPQRPRHHARRVQRAVARARRPCAAVRGR